MNATKRTTEDKLAIKSAIAHHKQFIARFPDRARAEKQSLQLHLLASMKNAKSQVRFAIL